MTVIVLMYFIHYQKHRKEVDNRFLNFVCKNFLLLRVDKLVQSGEMYRAVLCSVFSAKIMFTSFPSPPKQQLKHSLCEDGLIQ